MYAQAALAAAASARRAAAGCGCAHRPGLLPGCPILRTSSLAGSGPAAGLLACPAAAAARVRCTGDASGWPAGRGRRW
eukprot:6047264-Alexandrium_andersonii.AAC.1